MKANKLMIAVLAMGALVFASCEQKKNDPVNPGDDPVVIDPDTTTQAGKPEITVSKDSFVFIVNITTEVCGKVYIEGKFQGWNLAEAWEMAPVAGAEGWYAVTLPAWPTDSLGACKVLLSDDEGNIPGDWSSQWNSQMVTVDAESADYAALADDSGQQAINFTVEGGENIYATIAGWQNSPCASYGVAANAQIKCAAESWNYTDMTKVSDGVFTFTTTLVANEDASITLGANIGVQVNEDDFVESWYADPETNGATFAAGDKVTYTFTSTNGPKGTLVIAAAAE